MIELPEKSCTWLELSGALQNPTPFSSLADACTLDLPTWSSSEDWNESRSLDEADSVGTMRYVVEPDVEVVVDAVVVDADVVVAVVLPVVVAVVSVLVPVD